MSDVPLLAQTLRVIRDGGGGVAHRIATPPQGSAWMAGATLLNTQAVFDLVGCGWLTAPDPLGRIRIDAFPTFAM